MTWVAPPRSLIEIELPLTEVTSPAVFAVGTTIAGIVSGPSSLRFCVKRMTSPTFRSATVIDWPPFVILVSVVSEMGEHQVRLSGALDMLEKLFDFVPDVGEEPVTEFRGHDPLL